MNTTDPNPYEILGVPPGARTKDILLAQGKAIKDGKYDRAVIIQAMQDLTNESKRAEVDVLRVGEPQFDYARELPSVDPHALLRVLAEDAPELAPALLTPWQALTLIRAQLEDCPLEPILPEPAPSAQHHDQIDITFPL